MENQQGLLLPASVHPSAATVMPSSSPFFGTYDDRSLLESGLYGRTHGDSRRRMQERIGKMGKSVHPKLTVLLEFFRELYFRRKELLNKIFPRPPPEFKEFFDILCFRSDQMEFRTIQRSLSVGSPRMASSGKEVEPPLRLERFRVRTVNVGNVQGGGGSGQGETKPPGSK